MPSGNMGPGPRPKNQGGADGDIEAGGGCTKERQEGGRERQTEEDNQSLIEEDTHGVRKGRRKSGAAETPIRKGLASTWSHPTRSLPARFRRFTTRTWCR